MKKITTWITTLMFLSTVMVYFALKPAARAIQAPEPSPPLPEVVSLVDGVTISNPHFVSGHSSLIEYDVTNHTDKAITCFTVRSGTATVGIIFDTGTGGEKELSPGATFKHHFESANVQNGTLVLTAAFFSDGSEHGTVKDIALQHKNLESERRSGRLPPGWEVTHHLKTPKEEQH